MTNFTLLESLSFLRYKSVLSKVVIVIASLFVAFFSSAQTYNVTKVLDNGPAESTYNLVVLAEAFTPENINRFEEAVQYIPSVLNENEEFRNHYLSKINIYAISVISEDSTVSEVSTSSTAPIKSTTLKKTEFGVHFLNSYRAYFFADSTVNRAHHIAKEHVPFADNMIILVNGWHSPQLSGRASQTRKVSIASINSNFATAWEKYLLIHEAAHAIGGLSDAYSSTQEETFNKTTVNDPSVVRWKHLLSNPNVGILEKAPGAFIPSANCLMNKYGHTFFCPVCAEQMHKTIMSPKSTNIPSVHSISYDLIDTDNKTFSFSWDSVANATAYEVVYQSNYFVNGVWTKEFQTKIVTSTNVTFVLQNFERGFSDDLTIRAYNSSYSTPYQNFIITSRESIIVHFTKPTNVQTSVESTTSFKATWDLPSKANTTLIRLWNSNGEFSETYTNKKEITFNNLTPGATYNVEFASSYGRDYISTFDKYYDSPFTNKESVNLQPLSTARVEADQDLQIYPSPASDELSIQNLKEKSKYSVYDAQGSSVLSGVVAPNEMIEVGNLSSGVYMLSLSSGRVLRFVKE